MLSKNVFILLIFSLILSFSACTKQDKTATTSKDSAGTTGTVQGNGEKEEVKFETQNFSKSYNDCEIKAENCTYILVSYEKLISGASKDRINSAVSDTILRSLTGFDSMAPKTIDQAMTVFIDEYTVYKKDFPDGPDMPWTSETTGKHEYNSGRILSYSIANSSFTGGAHPNYYTMYYNFDLNTGKTLTLGDLLKPGFEAKLNALIDKKYREKNQLTASESLQAAGLFENEIKFNENFAVVKDGLMFYYNNYEIASYAAGPSEIVLTLSELSDLIKIDGLLN